MLRHRLVLMLVTALLSAGVLAACGGGGDDETGGGGSQAEAPGQTDAAPSDTETEEDAAPTETGDAAAGENVFSENCAGCHGQDGGGGTGPALAGNEDASDAEQVLKQIREGGGGMPPFEGQLSDEEIANVAAYVVETLSKK